MDVSERSILATLSYYGALRWPLTFVELAERMIPPSRFGSAEHSFGIGVVVSSVSRLIAAGSIRSESGLLVAGDEIADMAQHRIGREAVSADKWRAMLRRAWWFQMIPYVRMMSAGGSLAMGSSSPQSDWDMFVIAQAGRIYTARFGLLVVAALMGRLRTKRMRVAPDRFCFNHIITTDGLAIRHRSLFTAHALSWLVPFYDPWRYAARLWQANLWVGDFVATQGTKAFIRRMVGRPTVLGVIRRCAEFILDTFVGGAVESLLRRWMQRRILADPATDARGGRIVADDRELEFHPKSFEAVALQRYNAALMRLGLGQFTEHDSGLRH